MHRLLNLAEGELRPPAHSYTLGCNYSRLVPNWVFSHSTASASGMVQKDTLYAL